MSKIDAAANDLFAAFQRMIPLEKASGQRARGQLNDKIATSLDGFYAEARRLRQQHNLGIVARARVLKRFQSSLVEAGYDGELITKVVFSLLLSAFVGRLG